MNLLNFTTTFLDKESCKQKWKAIRDQQGVICPKCGSPEHYWKSDKESYECKHCLYRQSLRANTIMHRSRFPFRYWFIAFHLLTSTRKSFSAEELQRQSGHKYYEAIWSLLHKIRIAGDKRDEILSKRVLLQIQQKVFR